MTMNKFAGLKDQDVEARIFFHRTIWMLVFIVSLITLLITQLVKLQVVEYEKYTTKSKDNYIKEEPAPPSRGLIFDRNGVLLAENNPILSLQIIPEKIKCESRSRRKHAKCIEDLLDLLHKNITLEKKERNKFLAKYHINQRFAKTFEPIIIRHKLDPEEQAIITAISHRLPGVYITPGLIRSYPYPNSLAHVIGYVRQAGKKIESKWTPEEKKNYAGTTHVGVQGIEKEYEKILHGTVGKREVERNVYGRVAKTKTTTEPIAGKNIYLTIDIKLQTIAEKAFGNKAGAVVAIDTKKGEILALVSKPGFDPNLFVTGISQKDYAKLQRHPQKPLNARAVVGTYPPGSTIKPFYGLGSVHLKRMKPETAIHCKGKYFLPGVKRPWRDWKKEGHGKVELAKAIMRSCDVYFYELANRMKIDRITKTLSMFGWGLMTGIDMPQERIKKGVAGSWPRNSFWGKKKFVWKGKWVYDKLQKKRVFAGEYRDVGILPSRKWKAWRFRNHKNPWERKWYPGDTINVGIGQGNVTISPLQLAVATATMANRGRQVVPHLLRAVQPPGKKDLIHLNPGIDKKGKVTSNDEIPEYKLPPVFVKQFNARRKELNKVKPDVWNVVHKGMIAVIHGWNDSGWGGTARRLIKITKKRFKIAGKTGTAQVFSVHKDKEYKQSELPEHLWDNALFMSFAPADNPRIAIAVVVEHGGHGGSAAAPIAGKIIKAYLADLLVEDPNEKKKSRKSVKRKKAQKPVKKPKKNHLKPGSTKKPTAAKPKPNRTRVFSPGTVKPKSSKPRTIKPETTKTKPNRVRVSRSNSTVKKLRKPAASKYKVSQSTRKTATSANSANVTGDL